MKYSFLFTTVLLLAGCSATEIPQQEIGEMPEGPAVEYTGNMYTDEAHGVSFVYPEEWESRTLNDLILFAANFDYIDGLSKSSTSTELEGTLVYHVIENPEGLSYADYSEQDFQKCMNQESTGEFGPICSQDRVKDWTQTELDAHVAYLSDWESVPESGELAKTIAVELPDQKSFVILRTVKTGVTDEQKINSVFEKAWASLNIQ